MSEERGVRSRKWYETIERSELQAMSESHRAWQLQLQQAEMQAQAAAEAQRAPWPVSQIVDHYTKLQAQAAEAQAQRADEPTLPERWRDHCADQERAIAALHEAIDMQSKTIAELRAQMSDPPQSEQPATDTSAGAVQRRIDDVCQDLVAGRTTPDQRRGLGGAVERAGRIPAGSDAAVGRIARLPR